MLYRVLKTLWRGEHKPRIYPGTFTRLEWLNGEGIERLKRAGAVNEVAPPPLTALPGWKRRAQRLRALNIADATQFLETDGEAIAQHLRVKAATVERWRQELKMWMVAPPPPSGG